MSTTEQSPIEDVARPAEVRRESFEERLERVLAEAASPEAGIFGPDSVVWKVARHSPVYLLSTPLGGFIDSAHPWIAQGVAEHSKLFTDPHRRARMTYLLLMQIVFGDVGTVRRTSRALFGLHARVQGAIPAESGRFAAGSRYLANEEQALLWVHLVFFWTRLTMYERVVGRLSTEERDKYVVESARFAACFGIPEELLPTSHAQFEGLVDEIAHSNAIATTEASRKTVAFLVGQVPAPARPTLKALLAETLHEPLLDALELPGRSWWTRLVNAGLTLVLRAGRLLAPRSLAYLPAYLEAVERLGGPAQPKLSRRLSLRLVGRQ